MVNITSNAVAYDFFWARCRSKGRVPASLSTTNGHILTNFHVIEGGRQIEVTLANKHKYKAEVVG